jgi:hypothetical protein
VVTATLVAPVATAVRLVVVAAAVEPVVLRVAAAAEPVARAALAKSGLLAGKVFTS